MCEDDRTIEARGLAHAPRVADRHAQSAICRSPCVQCSLLGACRSARVRAGAPAQTALLAPPTAHGAGSRSIVSSSGLSCSDRLASQMKGQRGYAYGRVEEWMHRPRFPRATLAAHSLWLRHLDNRTDERGAPLVHREKVARLQRSLRTPTPFSGLSTEKGVGVRSERAMDAFVGACAERTRLYAALLVTTPSRLRRWSASMCERAAGRTTRRAVPCSGRRHCVRCPTHSRPQM